jgi:hypothetical protein
MAATVGRDFLLYVCYSADVKMRRTLKDGSIREWETGAVFQKGFTPWNKGLSAKTDPRVKENIEKSFRTRGVTKPVLPECACGCGGIVRHRRGSKKNRYIQGHHLKLDWVREKMMAGLPKGKDHPCWQGGKTEEQARLRNTARYRAWRKAVFERDDYTCQDCSRRGGDLEAHHLRPWSLYHDLRFEVSNGQTLCVKCHRKTDSFGRQRREDGTFSSSFSPTV